MNDFDTKVSIKGAKAYEICSEWYLLCSEW